MALSKADIRTDVQLRIDRFNTQDIAEFRKAEAKYFELSAELEAAEKVKDFDKVLDLEERVAELEFRLRYQGKDTRDVPVAGFRQMLHEGTFSDSNVKAAFQRIKNPATAIRAFCTFCMSGQTAEIRRCQAVTCPLWPFRLGQNPFFGKVLPAVVARDLALEDTSEDVAVEEDDSEGADDAD
jgi:hypothetical protein